MKYYKNAIINLISNPKAISALFFLAAITISSQLYIQTWNHYQNYLIFKNSFYHLIEYKDLYQLFPNEHVGFYKYSPAFSMFFGIFSWFPDLAGLNLWNLLNAFIFLISVYYLPKLDKTQKGLILILCFLELNTSMENVQSNALIAGLIILCFGLLERQNYLLATFLIVFSIFIKLYGAVGLVLFIFYPEKWKLILYTLAWSLVLLLSPLLLISVDQLKFLYSGWIHLIANDHSIEYGFSVMGIIHTWFGVDFNKLMIMFFGIIAFLLPLIRIKQYKNYNFRLLTLTSILIWVIIFNHMAESPTFIIAFAGVSIWFISEDKNILNIILFLSALILTSLSPTDIFPKYIRDTYVTPYALKALPCILIWIKINYDLYNVRP